MEIENVALRLKDAVWNEYNVDDLPEEKGGLFCVLDPTQPSTETRQKEETIALNLFSVSFSVLL